MTIWGLGGGVGVIGGGAIGQYLHNRCAPCNMPAASAASTTCRTQYSSNTQLAPSVATYEAACRALLFMMSWCCQRRALTALAPLCRRRALMPLFVGACVASAAFPVWFLINADVGHMPLSVSFAAGFLGGMLASPPGPNAR